MARLARLRSTYEKKRDAEAAAQKVIEARVAACTRIWRVASLYRWKGKIMEAEEWVLEAHAQVDGVDACWEALLDGHPYETPCVEVLGEVDVPARYKAWADRVTK